MNGFGRPKKALMKPQAVFTVKHRCMPKLAVAVACNEVSERTGKVLASELIRSDFSVADLEAAAGRLVPQVSSHDVILPTGIEL